MERRTVFLALVAMTLSAVVGWGAEETAMDKTYPLEEVSIFECDESIKYQLQSGQPVVDCGDTPSKDAIYPKLKSSKPIYGSVPFNMSLFDPQAGLECHFVLDESAGAGYDRLYFDLNRDLDLTNDAPVGLATKLPAGMPDEPGVIRFQNIQVMLDYGPGQGAFTQAVMPRMMKAGERTIVFFTAPTARKGKIRLGSEEVDLVLSQTHTISGRYDGPMTGAFLIGKRETLPLMGYWRSIDGTFYRLLATPAGDKVTVSPYTGPFGTFQIGSADEGQDSPTIDLGYIHSKEAFFDIGQCPQEDGTMKLPVGDYRPLRLAVRYGDKRIGLAVDTSLLGQEDAPAVFPYKIRQDRPLSLDFSGRLEVVFKTPAADARVTAGEMLQVEAMLCNTATGLMIAAIEDTTKVTRSLDLPDGRKMEMFESVDPTIKITNSSGRVVAEGKMPFG